MGESKLSIVLLLSLLLPKPRYDCHHHRWHDHHHHHHYHHRHHHHHYHHHHHHHHHYHHHYHHHHYHHHHYHNINNLSEVSRWSASTVIGYIEQMVMHCVSVRATYGVIMNELGSKHSPHPQSLPDQTRWPAPSCHHSESQLNVTCRSARYRCSLMVHLACW